MKLHLGCGYKKIEGFVNVDIRPELDCDVISDISKLENFENGSSELIYACHVLEHFKRHEYINVLKRWKEVLIPGGILRLSVPDFEQVCFMYYDKKLPLRKLIGFLNGGQTYEQNFHYMNFDFNMLKEDLENIGFEDVKRWDWKGTEHKDIDDYSQAYIPHLDKEKGILMSLNIEAKKIY